MNSEQLSGLEVMKSMLEGRIPPAPISEIVPMKPMEVARGYIKITTKADKRHINPLGGVPGGFTVHVSKKIGVAEGKLQDANGNLYAYATATCIIYR